jgi:uncharacterized protein YjbI with pentapeptide repeats
VIQGFADPRWPEERTYRITHEALVARIQQYGEEGSSRNRARQIFHHGLTLWLQGGKQPEDLLPEYHFDSVQRQIEDLVLRTVDERLFYQECKDKHNARWMRQLMEERRQRLQQRLGFGLIPLVFVVLGITLGQAPVGFVTLNTAQLYLAIRLKWPNLDLSETNLQEADLSGMDLRNVILTGADLRGANLSNALLSGVDLTATDLRQTNFRSADLRGAVLRDSRLRKTNFTQADLRTADLSGLDLGSGTFDGATFSLKTRWTTDAQAGTQAPINALGPKGSAPQLSLPGANLAGQDLYELSAPGANFAGANLQGAELTLADLTDASLREADLSRARLEKSILVRADLSGTILQDANLKGALATGVNLEASDLMGADLREVNLSESKLCGADLSQARLNRTILRGAEICAQTEFPPGFEVPAGVVVRPESP